MHQELNVSKSSIEPESPPCPTVLNRPLVAGAWQYLEQLSTLFVPITWRARDREVLKVQPQHESPANKISSCVKGKFGWDYVDSDERLTKPLVRKNGQFEEVEWEEALQVELQELGNILNNYLHYLYL